MMPKSRRARIGLYVVFAGAIAAGGWGLGVAVREHRAARATKEMNEGLQNYLEENVVGLAIGSTLPEIPVWLCGQDSCRILRQLVVSRGGMFYLGAGCPACATTLRSICEAWDEGTVRNQQLLLVLDGDDGFDSLLRVVEQRGLNLPLYCDVEQRLRREYRVLANPTFFRFDESGTLEQLLAITDTDPIALANLINENLN